MSCRACFFSPNTKKHPMKMMNPIIPTKDPVILINARKRSLSILAFSPFIFATVIPRIIFPGVCPVNPSKT